MANEACINSNESLYLTINNIFMSLGNKVLGGNSELTKNIFNFIDNFRKVFPRTTLQ